MKNFDYNEPIIEVLLNKHSHLRIITDFLNNKEKPKVLEFGVARGSSTTAFLWYLEKTEGKLCGVVNEGCYEWVTRSIQNYGDYIFPEIPKIKPWDYFNSGFIIANKTHEEFFDNVLQYYHDNVDKFIHAKSFHVGNDQTPLNYFTKKFNVKTKLLPSCYNLQDMARKTLFTLGYQNWSEDSLFLKAGWVYHFNAIPANMGDVAYWMEYTYNKLYENE